MKFDPTTATSPSTWCCRLNGLPVATVELKNPLTGQNVEHAIAQYRSDRDPKHRLFQFKKRALVHFAVDPDVVYMTTRLAGKDTFFLPVQPGEPERRRQPRAPAAATGPPTSGRRSGSATASSTSSPASSTSLTEEKQVDGQEGDDGDHDLPALPPARRRAAAGGGGARRRAPGSNYLVQHSAGHRARPTPSRGSRHRLAEPPRRGRPEGLRLGRGHHRPAGPRPAAPGHHLPVRAQAGRRRRRSTRTRPSSPRRSPTGTPIIITTLQKFPFVTEKIGAAARTGPTPSSWTRPTARQTGESAPKLKEVLGAATWRRRRRRTPRRRGGRRGRAPQGDGVAGPAEEPVASSPSPRRRRPRRWRCSAARTRTGSRARSTSTRCGRPSRRASSSTC